MTTPPDVLKLIQENQQRRDKVLDLSVKQLTEIPAEVYQLTHLEELNLWGNHISIIPESLRQLIQLRCLNICYNPIQQLPDINGLILDYDVFLAQRAHLPPAHIIGLRLKSISDEIVNDLLTLPQLTFLDLNGSQLSTLPKSIRLLTQLTSLNLNHNKLNPLPELITYLTRLIYLDLSGNQLSTLPESITRLTQLIYLDLSGNQLSTLPESITRLTQLTYLDLSHNELYELSELIIRLTHLTSLDLSVNQFDAIPNQIFLLKQLHTLSFGKDYWEGEETNTIKIIPRDILQLTDLEELELDHNPIENPPAEIAYQGIGALREYFAALDLGAVENNKAKLILVGNGRVGKTCISKALAGQPFSDKEKSTHGIRVVSLSLPTHAPHLDFQVWDFGGQDIYHATHRLFLSRRALYLLVWDSNTEQRAGTSQRDGEFTLEYWLDNIASLSDNSPVLVIQNKVDNTPPLHLPQDKLANRYQIKEFLKVSAKTGRGFDELKHQIAAQFQPEQPLYRMVGYKMPTTWLELRDELREHSQRQHSITYQNFVSRSKKLGINATAAAVLCRFLHETADILYFADEPKLKDLIAINPAWIAARIYDDENDNGILNRAVREQQGKFTRAHVRTQFAKLPKNKQLTEAEQDNFIQLLKRFELCFKVADPAEPDTFIAPQYLPSQQPQTVTWEWQMRPHPKFIYEYRKTIHHSVMVRFITRFGHLAQQQQYWRDGILFKQHDATALVECHHAERKITVHLKNDSTGQLAQTIDKNFNEINFYKQAKLFVPCCCAECEKTEDFHSYEVEKLEEFVTEKRKMTIECSRSGHTVEIEKLVGSAMIDYWLKREDDRRDFSPSDESDEIEDTTENDMNDVEPAPVETGWWKIYREAKKVILDEPIEFAMEMLNLGIQHDPKLKFPIALLGLAAIIFLIQQFNSDFKQFAISAAIFFSLIVGWVLLPTLKRHFDALMVKTVLWSLIFLWLAVVGRAIFSLYS